MNMPTYVVNRNSSKVPLGHKRFLMLSAIAILFSVAFSILVPTQAIAGSDIKITGLDGIDTLSDISEQIDTNQSSEIVAHELHYLLEQQGYILASPTVLSEDEVQVRFGKILKVSVSGFSKKTTEKIEDYFQPTLIGVPNIKKIDRALALTNDMAGVSATVAFAKLSNLGEYEAVVSGVESTQSGVIALDTVSRKFFDDKRVLLQQNFSSVFQGGDLVRLQGSFVDPKASPNSQSVYGSYLFPISNQGAYVELSAGDFQTELAVEGRSTGIQTSGGFIILPGSSTNRNFEGQSASATFGYPLERLHGRATYLIGSIDWSDDETQSVGDTETTSIDLSLFSRHDKTDGQSVAYGLTIGAGDTDSYVNRESGTFQYLQGSFGLIQPISGIAENTELRFELFGQISSDKTAGSKLIGLGSEQSLRGYSNAIYTGQTGVWGSIEIARSVAVDSDWTSQITPLAFLDFGEVRNSANNVTSSRPKSEQLASVGAGLRMNLSTSGQLEGFVGVPLLEDGSGKVPDPRVYLRLSWGW